MSLALLQNYSRLNEIKNLAGSFQFFSIPLKSRGFAAAFPVLVEELLQVASSMAQTHWYYTHYQIHVTKLTQSTLKVQYMLLLAADG